MTDPTITRLSLALEVHYQIGLARTESLQLVNSIFDVLMTGLTQEQELKIASFGSFQVNNKKERMGRNPKTKEEKTISARKVVSFLAAKNLKDHINNK